MGAHKKQGPEAQLINAGVLAINARVECPPDLDAYTYAAAAMFEIPYDDVTPEQRAFAKHVTFGSTP